MYRLAKALHETTKKRDIWTLDSRCKRCDKRLMSFIRIRNLWNRYTSGKTYETNSLSLNEFRSWAIGEPNFFVNIWSWTSSSTSGTPSFGATHPKEEKREKNWELKLKLHSAQICTLKCWWFCISPNGFFRSKKSTKCPGEGLAIFKGAICNGCHRLWDSDAGQRPAIPKGSGPDGCHRLRDSDSCQKTASLKGTASNERHRLRDTDSCQKTASLKGIVPNGCQRLWDFDACQRLASCKGNDPNVCDRLWDSDTCQRLAILKGTVPDGGHGLWDSDACQRLASCKGRIPNGCTSPYSVDRRWSNSTKLPKGLDATKFLQSAVMW